MPENFRPVCHLVEVGRVVELVVWDQLQDHCTRNNIIHKNHHGSVPGHDCVSAVGQVLDATTQAAEEKLLSAVIMLDQTAAFDIVDHGHLLMKMRLLNFDSKTLD